MGRLILVRHGESRWNLDGKFTGWVDVPLSHKGVKEAEALGKLFRRIPIDIAFTSRLERAHETLMVMLAAQKKTGIFLHQDRHNGFDYKPVVWDSDIPIHSDWHLNERHYGCLQGLTKYTASQKYGREKVLRWRRGYKDTPPGGESLRDVYRRAVPFFTKRVLSEVKAGKNVLVVAHGNTLRAIVKYIDGISDERVAHLELAPGTPFVFGFRRGRLVKQFKGYTYTRPLAWK